MHRRPRIAVNPNLPDRRTFLTAGVVSGVMAVAATTRAQAAEKGDQQQTPQAEEPSFELSELSLAQLQEGLIAGRYTSKSLCEKYLERIAAIDAQGPQLASVIEANPDALAIAERLDAERKSRAAWSIAWDPRVDQGQY